MEKFAKVFQLEKYGQVVVIHNTCDEGNPQLKFYFQPPELGVCEFDIKGKSDDDKSFDDFEKEFNDLDESRVNEIVGTIIEKLLDEG